MRKKTNSEIVKTIILAKKNNKWIKLAYQLSGSTRKYSSVNLDEIDKKSKEGDTLVVLGKVLGSGNLNKKVRVCALGFSASAVEKLKKTKSEISSLADEIKKNPKAEGIKILK